MLKENASLHSSDGLTLEKDLLYLTSHLWGLPWLPSGGLWQLRKFVEKVCCKMLLVIGIALLVLLYSLRVCEGTMFEFV